MSEGLVHADGREIRTAHEATCDVAIVGSGPAGATVARALSARGAGVIVIEEGPHVRPDELPASGFLAMAALYRDLGASVLLGRAPIPFVQGRAVGGSSVINGAISWRLPRDVHAQWVRRDPPLAGALPWEALEQAFDEIEQDLHIAPTEAAIAGPKNLLMARGAAALGIEHRPTFRNVRGCVGLGRCLQGCPLGRKMSMDRTYLPDAVRRGARIFASVRATRIEVERGAAREVVAEAAGGGRVRIRARGAVVLVASAVETSALLLRSGIRHGPVGENFQCHPGVSMAGRFPEPVRNWLGATQGHEVIGVRGDGLKLEALGYAPAILAMRLKGAGSELAAELERLERWANWGAAIRAEARGRVRIGPRGRAVVRFDLARGDVARLRRGVRLLGEMMLAAGAEVVAPSAHGWRERVFDRATMARFEDEAPWDPRAYSLAVTHMFGTCAMGSAPATSVVRSDFRHHGVEALYVADSSVFPTNTGVNPQTSIIALASLCARAIAAPERAAAGAG